MRNASNPAQRSPPFHQFIIKRTISVIPFRDKDILYEREISGVRRRTGSFAGKQVSRKEGSGMKYGARNQITGKVTDVKRGDVMSLVKFAVEIPAAMASVITTESLDDLALKPGDTVRLVIKAIHVLPVRD
jgi:molybdopterin-binding protein